MKKLIALIALLFSVSLSGCASFDEQAYWPDAAYGGALEKIALEGFRLHHEKWKTDTETGPHDRKTGRTDGDMHINPEPIAYCVDHSVWAAKELEARSADYDLVILTDSTGLRDSHSVLEVDYNGVKSYIDLNEREPYPAEEYTRFYDGVRNLGRVKSKNIRGVLTALGYQYK